MNELEPLLETSESTATRALLRAGRSDAPAREFSERLLLGLGVGVAVGTVGAMASAGTAAAAIQGAASSASGAASGAASLTVLVAKWVAVGVIGGGILAGGAEVAFAPRNAEPVVKVAASVQVPRSAPPAPASAPVIASPQRAAAPVASAEPTAVTAPPPSAAPSQGGQLGREVAAIDRARRAISQGKLAQALRELDAFDRLETTGVLAREAKVLRIETLYRLGQVERARKLVERYEKAYPNDTHGARLRALDLGFAEGKE